MTYRVFRSVVSAIVALQMVFAPVAPVFAEDSAAVADTVLAEPSASAAPAESAEPAPETNPTPEAPAAPAPENVQEDAAPDAPAANVSPIPTESISTTPEQAAESVRREPADAAASIPATPPAPEASEAASTTEEVKEKIETEVKPVPGYSALMREWKDAKDESGKAKIREKLDDFIAFEKERLDKLSIPSDRTHAYITRLEKQIRHGEGAPGKLEGLAEKIKEFFTVEEKKQGSGDEFLIPEHPARFNFHDPVIELRKNQVTSKKMEERLQILSKPLSSIFSIQEVFAGPLTLPTIADVQADEQEIVVTQEMRTLADSLDRNPVHIYNYVRENISYEPYFGAKKGALGCWRERRCNDTDASSLTIALMRAAGIPARYVKGVAVLPVETVKQIVGVDETKTAYAALYVSRVPVFLVSGNNVGPNYDAADFSKENYFGVEWTAVEIFYDYDERSGNFHNEISFLDASSTEAVRARLQDSREKQWVAIDPIVQPYTRVKNEIVADAAQFNGQTFWNSYLQYQGPLSPTDKYAADLSALTGKDVKSDQYHSSSTVRFVKTEILPPTLPYALESGITNDGVTIDVERWSVLPNDRATSIRISLKRSADKSVVLTQTIPSSQLLNVPLSVSYRGATEMDVNTIESYGGIAYTPAELVRLTVSLGNDNASFDSADTVSIGESLILSFEYYLGPTKLGQDEKFSVAGNEEGIYIVSSVVLSDPGVTTSEEAIFAGNASMAREYLKKIAASREVIGKSLDRQLGTDFMRAVVTQGRVLSKMNDIPTTFDFKGLTIDAAGYTTDFSRRGNYKDRQREYRLLYGLEASYYEGQIFRDFASLDAISTVKGIQEAYANPNDYTVHVIDKNNEQVIDGLNLSANTKANMHAQVQKGHVITTPDKPVTKGTFTGILYTSVAPDFTGTYAIGEQVQQNGGYTTDGVLLAGYCDSLCRFAYYKTDNTTRFVFEDRYVDSVRCKIEQKVSDNIKNNVGIAAGRPGYEYWKSEYGEPCITATKRFGNIRHTYILSTNAAKFYSDNLYNYWVKSSIAKSRVETDNPGKYFKTFKFNVVAGTYSLHNGSSYAAYYQPVKPASVGNELWSDKGRGWVVQGGILDKLDDRSYKPESLICSYDDNYCLDLGYKLGYVLNKIGYPVGPEIKAAPSFPYGTEGVYQDFIGGQVYYETTWLNHAYYVPGSIATEFNKQANCQPDYGCGSGGIYGFPVSDPLYNSQLDMIFQDFENGSRVKEYLARPLGQNIEVVEDVQTIAIIRNYTDPAFRDELIEGIMDAFYEQGLYDVGISFAAGLTVPFVVNQFKSFIVKKLGKTAVAKVGLKFAPGVGWVYSGVTVVLAVDANWPVYKACSTDPDQVATIDGKAPAYYCGKLGVNAAAFGLGSVSEVGASKIINRLGAVSYSAKLGKSKVLEAITNDEQWQDVTHALTNNSKIRNSVLENANKLTPQFMDDLLASQSLRKRFFSDFNFNRFLTNARDASRYDHIFRGNETGGWHYFATGREGSKLSNKVLGSNGVYKADVQIMVNGVLTDKKVSTFFPDSWSEDKVLTVINQAYDKILLNKKAAFVSGNTYRADIEGIDVRIFIDEQTNKLISAFPFFK